MNNLRHQNSWRKGIFGEPSPVDVARSTEVTANCVTDVAYCSIYIDALMENNYINRAHIRHHNAMDSVMKIYTQKIGSFLYTFVCLLKRS
jgi:hypothetical protein